MNERKLTLGFDIDGVLADFTSGYRAALTAVSGRECGLAKGDDPPCWDWATEVGHTKEEDKAAWKLMLSDPEFWFRLSPTLEAAQALAMLTLAYTEGHTTYFITNRMGVNPHIQTLGWLAQHGMAYPQVIVQAKANKGELAYALKLTHFIDDKPENCFDVKQAHPACEVYLLKKRYNDTAEYRDLAAKYGITIITTIREFFESIAAQENAHALVV